MPDVEHDYDLGYYYIKEAGIYGLSNMGNIASYIDHERYGRDVALEEGGVFTDKGYAAAGRDSFMIVYDGLESIPEEYKVMNVQTENEQEKFYIIGAYKVDIQINSYYSKEALEEILRIALEMRRRVKEQLKKIGGIEFYDINFSYIDNESFEEKYVSVPEQGSSTLIPEGMCNPGQVYTAAEGKS